METKELKFILKLLGCPNYRTGLSSSTFDSFKGEKNKICRDLGELEYVDYSREIATVKILPPGQALLKLDSAQLPIDDKELKVLEKIGKSSGKIAPSEIKVSSLKSDERDAILKTLGERGLIAIEIKMKRLKAEVWLTERGIEVLRDEYNPEGKANIDFNLLGNYVRFLRKNLRFKSEQVSTPDHVESYSDITSNISDEEILETIKKLDRELGTENYLPIFHLRQKLQPPLLRDDLDQALYRLQKSDKIELRGLIHAEEYTPDQVNAGISQRSGSPLFFIQLTEN
ncbi:MAG: transcription factor RcaD [Anabaena sp. LE011-02]|nr:MAG: transcription factor RcaD [Anabaena sp. LE011-02]